VVSTAKKESRKTRRAQAARERAREAHARLVVQRHGDPRFAQQTHTATGRTIQLRPEDVELLRRQQDLFVEKFGREPGPEDPLFFDPDSDTPTAIDSAAFFAETRAAAAHAGVDSAYIEAWEQVGYLITEQNQHLFSAHEVEAFATALQQARRRADTAQPHDRLNGDATIVDVSPERIAAARADVINRLGLTSDAAVEAARNDLGTRLGPVITMTFEDGERLAQIESIRTTVHPPHPSGALDQHVHDVVYSLREESLVWTGKLAGHQHLDPAVMPQLADFVLLCNDDEIAEWVHAQMSAAT
jgi:hypothetical protein